MIIRSKWIPKENTMFEYGTINGTKVYFVQKRIFDDEKWKITNIKTYTRQEEARKNYEMKTI